MLGMEVLGLNIGEYSFLKSVTRFARIPCISASLILQFNAINTISKIEKNSINF